MSSSAVATLGKYPLVLLGLAALACRPATVFDAGAPPPSVPPAPAQAVFLTPLHPEVLRPPMPAPLEAEFGLVDFRVRPSASVFVDGTLLGVTPFAKAKLRVGVHTVKLVNKGLGKEVTEQVEVKAGDNTLKYNLESE